MLCLADRTNVEVEWQVPLTLFGAFYTPEDGPLISKVVLLQLVSEPDWGKTHTLSI
jgi:hypothetical protein